MALQAFSAWRGSWLRAALAVAACEAASALPPSVVPKLALRYRFHCRTFWIDPAKVVKYGGPDQDRRPVKDALNAALSRSFVVDGDWDIPGRPFILSEGVEGSDLYRSLASSGWKRLGSIQGVRQGPIQVCIGRDGRAVLFNEGYHRITAARLLALPAAPVRVRGVHRLWAEEQLRRSGLPLASALERGLMDLAGAASMGPREFV